MVKMTIYIKMYNKLKVSKQKSILRFKLIYKYM